MKEKRIRALKIEPFKTPEVVTLDNTLRALQEAVSIGAPSRGLIEPLGIEPGVDLLINEEGKLIGLPPNRRFYNDIICGVFYVVGVDGEDFCSLPQNMIDKYTERFKMPEIINPDDVEITVQFMFFD